jgi:CheY-like chemotaxis protein
LSRKTPAAPKPLVLNEVVLRLEKLLRRLLDEQMTLELSLEAELDQVLADAAQLERLLVQLVGEARSQGSKGGRLLLETRNTELDGPQGPTRQVMLRVSDSSGALSPEIAALSSFVDAGTAWLENEPDCGTRFVACFSSLKTPTSSSPPPPEPRKKRQHSVLVVQDNPHLRKTLRTYFAREGYRVLDADSSLEALRIVEHDARLDLLLTDYALTDGSGPELARALRERLPELRVLIATSHPEQRAAIHEGEHTATISKPFDLREFAAMIERLLAGDAAAQP